MRDYNRTDAAQRLAEDVTEWCAATATPPNSVGHVLFLHPGFVALLRKRLTVTPEKEEAVRAFMAAHPAGWRGKLPQTHLNWDKARIRRVERTSGALPPTVDRDPCQRCGVRHDIGCHHTRAPVGMMM